MLVKDLSSCYPFVDITRVQVKLTTLDIGNNFISVIENLSHLKLLEELWVRKSLLACSVNGSTKYML